MTIFRKPLRSGDTWKIEQTGPMRKYLLLNTWRDFGNLSGVCVITVKGLLLLSFLCMCGGSHCKGYYDCKSCCCRCFCVLVVTVMVIVTV